MGSRVVVTGLGAVSGWGVGGDTLWSGLCSGKSCIRPFDRFDASTHRTRLAGQVPAPDGAPLSLEPGQRRLSLADRFALAATKEALGQAELPSELGSLAAGVFFGSSTGGMLESEWFYDRLQDRSLGFPHLDWLVSQQYNGPGDAVAREVGATGTVSTVSSACTSGAVAVGAGFEAILRGELDVAVTGGSDSLCQLTYAGFNSLRSLDSEPSRPFRENRAGLSLGEGAGVLVLESLDHAASRGAVPIAEVLGVGYSCDAYHMTAPEQHGAGAARAIRGALEQGAILPAEVSFVNAHGTGTPLNDAAEWEALESVFGERAREIPITAPKAAVGHLLGAAGALEAVATAQCLQHRAVFPTADGDAAELAFPIRLVLNAPLPCPDLRYGISTNLAFGGSNSALLLAAWQGERP